MPREYTAVEAQTDQRVDAATSDDGGWECRFDFSETATFRLLSESTVPRKRGSSEKTDGDRHNTTPRRWRDSTTCSAVNRS
jgi:hypothetical protein